MPDRQKLNQLLATGAAQTGSDAAIGSRSSPGALWTPRKVDGPDVVVWEADGEVDGRVGYGAAIAARFRRQGLRVEVVPLVRRRPQGAELEAPRHVISGGSTAVTSGVGWLTDTRRHLDPVLDRALTGSIELTGICFGAQLLAAMLAGSGAVGPHPEGIQAGLVEAVDVEGEHHVVSSFHYHHIDPDRLTAAGGTVVMSSARTPVQAYVVGDGVQGVQFHPELTPSALASSLGYGHEVMARTGGSLSGSLASIATHGQRWDGELWRSIFAGPVRDRRLPSAV
jgi:GMP synthase-like glutamine amidotransferase